MSDVMPYSEKQFESFLSSFEKEHDEDHDQDEDLRMLSNLSVEDDEEDEDDDEDDYGNHLSSVIHGLNGRTLHEVLQEILPNLSAKGCENISLQRHIVLPVLIHVQTKNDSWRASF